LINFYLFLWWAWQRLSPQLAAAASLCKTSAELRLENIALRQQLAVLRRSAPKRLKLTPADRIFSGVATPLVVRLEIRPDDRQGRDSRRLAPEGLPLVLDVENTPRQAGSGS
jgi:hypothetical protein